MLRLPLVYKFFLAERDLNMVGIYKFTNKITGESYIGKTKDIKRRYLQHKNRCDPAKSNFESTYFHKEIAKYGFEAFDFQVVEECNVEELDEKEIYYINKFNSLYPNGYNKESGGTHAPHSFKTTWDEIYKIQQDIKDGELYLSEIAKKYNLSTSEINMINSGQIWKSDGEKYPLRDPKPMPKKEGPFCIKCGKPITKYCGCKYCKKCYYSELKRFIPTKELLVDLLKKHKQVDIAKMYGVSRETVRNWRLVYNVNRKGDSL